MLEGFMLDLLAKTKRASMFIGFLLWTRGRSINA